MISFIVPTLGRASILATLTSIRPQPEDEIIVIGNVAQTEIGQTRYIPCLPGGDGGNKERNIAMRLARGTHLAFIDDDDRYLPCAREAMATAMASTPDAPVLFRMRFPNGITLWTQKKVLCGNVGTPMIFIPNRPEMFGIWWEGRNCGDFGFMSSIKWREDEIVWRHEIVAQIGHNPGEAPTDKFKLAARAS